MDVMGKMCENEHSKGFATILAIGTANPPDIMYQAEYPEFYFRVTDSEHLTDLKDKFSLICSKTMIRKRHMFVTEEIVREHPEIRTYDGLSFGVRQEVQIAANLSLGKEAALKALEEWDQPISKITHLVFCATQGVDLPGADYQLIELMGLSPNVKRVMLYGQGCFGGGTVLRVAKDLAENNSGARVLAICCEITISCFRGPTKDDLSTLVGHAIFADGAAAMVVGANPTDEIEQPIFTIVSTFQTIVPNGKGTTWGHFGDAGLKYYIDKSVTSLIAENLEGILTEAFSPLGIDDWNSIFWAPHPGGRAILDSIEKKLTLNEGKLTAARAILREYGNMLGASVIFILDEMRKRSAEDRHATTGEGLEWGVLFGFGPGLTVETAVLRSARTAVQVREKVSFVDSLCSSVMTSRTL